MSTVHRRGSSETCKASISSGSTAVVPPLARHTSKHRLNIHANLQKWQIHFGDNLLLPRNEGQYTPWRGTIQI